MQPQKPQPGARVRVTANDVTYEGILLPSAEMGTGNILLKLDSGYNIGIDKTSTIEVLAPPKELSFPIAKLQQKKGLPRIALIATGGTIGSRVDYRTGGVHMLLTPEQLLFNVPELQGIVSIETIERPFAIASEDMYFEEWQEIARQVVAALQSGLDGVIITHGTDTLHYTAAALSFMLQGLDKPVALVGGQRSSDRGSFDGAMNLVCAAHYMSSGIGEVALVMHAGSDDDACLAIRGTTARKMHTSRRDAFRPVNQLPLAKIWPDGKIERIHPDPRPASQGASHGRSKVILKDSFAKVALVKLFPGADPEVLDFHRKQGCKGIVLEGTGLGHVITQPQDASRSWIPAIQRCAEAGVLIVISSQCLYGRINQQVYSNLRILHQAGAISAQSMTPECAYVKLSWALGQTTDKDKAAGVFTSDIAGEIAERTLHETFLY
ncbi:glutamyl-tRNA(Gln) amidotransferase subunit D [Candidatus Woesearchaeota archaeon CG1_02_57_44]|nr:MAG: glutamyl-tRNA(Gln) amidotransferase subunit D [Candidatus Woesearchaeota archaeon CG1_02_57_44]